MPLRQHAKRAPLRQLRVSARTPDEGSLRMRIELDGVPPAAATWPTGIALRGFTAADARPLHRLLEHGYRDGGGHVAPFPAWLEATIGDADFDPQLCFLALAGEQLAGAALCWRSAFVKDLVVDESWRRRGLGEQLLRHVFATFAARGAAKVELKLEPTNEAALRLYTRVGMVVVERPHER